MCDEINKDMNILQFLQTGRAGVQSKVQQVDLCFCVLSLSLAWCLGPELNIVYRRIALYSGWFGLPVSCYANTHAW